MLKPQQSSILNLMKTRMLPQGRACHIFLIPILQEKKSNIFQINVGLIDWKKGANMKSYKGEGLQSESRNWKDLGTSWSHLINNVHWFSSKFKRYYFWIPNRPNTNPRSFICLNFIWKLVCGNFHVILRLYFRF